jgi:hypothetical protein
LEEPDPLEEPNPLQEFIIESAQDKTSRKRQKKLIQVVALWRMKQKSDARDIFYSLGFISLNFTISYVQIM